MIVTRDVEGADAILHYHAGDPEKLAHVMDQMIKDRIVDVEGKDFWFDHVVFSGDSSIFEGHDQEIRGIGDEDAILVVRARDSIIRDFTLKMSDGVTGVPILVEGDGCWLDNIRIVGEDGMKYEGPPIRFTGANCMAFGVSWTDHWSEPADVGDTNSMVHE